MHSRVMCFGSKDVFVGWVRGFPMLTILLTLPLSACSNGGSSHDLVPGRSAADAVELLIHDGSFDPETLKLSKNDQVSVMIVNNDSAPHDFAIESIDLKTRTIEPGDAVTATFTPGDATGEFVCTLHPEMEGRIDLVQP
jgi:plastocyanin